jgi:hypothetical protein
MDYLTGNQFLTLNDYKNIEIFQNENYNQDYQIGGGPSSLDLTICIGIMLLYISITILVIVYFNKNKTNGMEKNDIIKKNSLFVLMMIIFSAGIYSSIHIGTTTNQILLFSSVLCAIGLSTNGIFYFSI